MTIGSVCIPVTISSDAAGMGCLMVNAVANGRWAAKLTAGVPVLALTLLGSASPLLAEDVRGQGVAERQYEAYTPLGVRAGGFVLRPSLAVSETYDSNVFATNTGEVDDFVTEINPNVVAESEWSRHAVRLEANVAQRLYASESGEDTTDWTLGANGRIDVLDDTVIRVGFLYGSLSEDRGAPEAIGAAAEPTTYEQRTASASLTQRFNRLSGEVGATYTELDFDDTPLIGGGVDDNDDRDRSVLEIAVEAGYELVADTVVFLRGTYNVRDYEQEVPVAAVDRDSDGYELVAGASFELGSLATGEVFAGYQEQSFEDPSFAAVTGLAYGASVDWYATPLTTVRFRADTSIEDTTSGGASAFERQRVGVGLDHEFLRNLIASLDLEFAQEDFSGSTRKDEIYDVTFGVDYLIDRVFSIGFFVGHEERDSTVSGESFSRDTAGIRVRSEL